MLLFLNVGKHFVNGLRDAQKCFFFSRLFNFLTAQAVNCNSSDKGLRDLKAVFFTCMAV